MPAAPVSIHPYFKVLPGQMEAARALLPQFIARTATEAKVLSYDFTVEADVIHCREAYEDAEGVLAHLANVRELLEEMLRHSELLRLEFQGPEAELAQLREPLAQLNPSWYAVVARLEK